ncbi:MAG: hypothetical protein BMS9Abin04_575 [Planctomycetia bacterium]|nr:MAG: hypothetical protein BMS9Abin04_575 [Planctomycetia bacterium]
MDIITGMHRSGTSLVARLFLEAGADLGPADSFYRPDRWNPDGYFEQPDIHAVNMPLINGPWGRFAYFKLPATRTILARAERRREQIARTAAKYEHKVVKETRFCLTLPAWLAHGAPIRRVLVCLRDPVVVVDSIHRRNWIGRGLGYRLWLVHLERLLAHAGDLPLWFVRYENLLEPSTFESELRPALHFLDLAPDDRRLQAMREKVVKPHWSHSPRRRAEPPPRVQQLWRRLGELHAGQGRQNMLHSVTDSSGTDSGP